MLKKLAISLILAASVGTSHASALRSLLTDNIKSLDGSKTYTLPSATATLATTDQATTSTEWVSFTPTIDSIGGTPAWSPGTTITGPTAWWRRVGDSMFFRFEFAQSSAGANGGGGTGWGFLLPNSKSIDSSKITCHDQTAGSPYYVNFGRPMLGYGILGLAGAPSINTTVTCHSDYTHLMMYMPGGYYWGNGYPLNSGAEYVSFETSGFPISGWTNNN